MATSAGQSAAKPSQSLHATREFVTATVGAANAPFVAEAATRARISASGTCRRSGSRPRATASPSVMPSPEVSGTPGSVPYTKISSAVDRPSLSRSGSVRSSSVSAWRRKEVTPSASGAVQPPPGVSTEAKTFVSAAASTTPERP